MAYASSSMNSIAAAVASAREKEVPDAMGAPTTGPELGQTRHVAVVSNP